MPITIQDLIKHTMLGSGSGSGGGSAPAVSPKEVNFYDYDGTCVHACTVAEAQALSALPAGPEHPGLVFQGWNWSLEGVRGLTRAMNIGAMYTTDDGTTRLYITLQEGRTSPMLGVGVNGTVTVDWGDGTEPDVLTGTSTSTTKWTPNHAYAKPGDYVIRLTVDGEVHIWGEKGGDLGSNLLRYSATADKRNIAYQNALKKLEIGSGVGRIVATAFQYCRSLEFVTIPESVSAMSGQNIFDGCYALAHVNFPSRATNLGNYCCRDCHALASMSFPEQLQVVGGYAFQMCYSLAHAVIPDAASVGSLAFGNCTSLVHAILPASIASVEYNLFYNCTCAAVYDFSECEAVPTMGATTQFNGIPADCEIRVPAALYDEWIAATNWATYADKIKAY